jgi:hypothetical protein
MLRTRAQTVMGKYAVNHYVRFVRKAPHTVAHGVVYVEPNHQ